MRDSVIYVVPGKMGGVITNLDNLVSHVDRERFAQHVTLTYNELDRDARFDGELPVDHQGAFHYALPLENVYSVLARFQRTMPEGGGVLVASEWLELAAVTRYGTDRAVVQVLHGDFDYYYELAERHEDVIDVFIACSRFVHRKLGEKLPARRDDMFYVPYGVPLAEASRRGLRGGTLRLVYAGRIDRGQKRSLDLPKIDAALCRKRVPVQWTIVGDGPDGAVLRETWKGGHVRWAGVLSNRDTLELLSQQDVFVLPSRAEGLPLSLLEAMGAGVVPVVSDLESGIPELVHEGVTGSRVPVGDVDGFAEAIAKLAREPSRLETMGGAASDLVRGHFGIERQASQYQDIFRRWRELRRSKTRQGRLPYGSRLDHPWIPNRLVRFIRGRRRPELKALRAGAPSAVR